MTQFMDLPATKRAALGREWDSKWRQEHPDRAAYLDDHPPGPALPCDICGYHAKRGEQRTKRRWDWDDKNVENSTFVWRCNGCFKQHGRTPKQELTTPPPVFDAETKRRIAAASIPTEANPDYLIVDGVARRVTETDREFLARMQDNPDAQPVATGWDGDDEPDPNRPHTKLDSWFATPIDEDR